ncbi:MAG: DNA repair protein RecO [Candidatus Theseobacter exili]|nr:DNA repair protein RecO [Candidatus Theseobacter exili]
MRSEGIVLRKAAYSESSLIVTFFTRDWGKIKVAIRGARRLKSPFSSALEFFFRNEIVLSGSLQKTREIHSIRECSVLQPFLGLRQTPERFAVAAYCGEILESVLPLESREEDIYDWVLDYMTILEKAEDALIIEMLVRYFEINIIKKLGLLNDIKQCRLCGKQGALSASHGKEMLICKTCASGSTEFIQAGTLAIAHQLSISGPGRIRNLQSSVVQRRELERLGYLFVDSVLEKKIKSREFLMKCIHKQK